MFLYISMIYYKINSFIRYSNFVFPTFDSRTEAWKNTRLSPGYTCKYDYPINTSFRTALDYLFSSCSFPEIPVFRI